MNDILEVTIQCNKDVLTGQQPDIHHIQRVKYSIIIPREVD